MKTQMRAYLTQVPDYVCRVNVERYQGSGRGRLPLRDRLRLEVAYVGGRELYAMPGATRFGGIATFTSGLATKPGPSSDTKSSGTPAKVNASATKAEHTR